MARQQDGDDVIAAEDDGVPAAQCTGALAGVAAAAQGHLIAIEVTNLGAFPDLEVADNGALNQAQVPDGLGYRVYVDGLELAPPDLLFAPPLGKRYRVPFNAIPTGVIPGVPDGHLVEISRASSPSNLSVTMSDDGTVALGT